MDLLVILRYGGIGALIALLIVFELTGRESNRSATGFYEYYTQEGRCLRIRHIIATRYKIYDSNPECPVPTKEDRYGQFFALSALSTGSLEAKVEAIYSSGGTA